MIHSWGEIFSWFVGRGGVGKTFTLEEWWEVTEFFPDKTRIYYLSLLKSIGAIIELNKVYLILSTEYIQVKYAIRNYGTKKAKRKIDIEISKQILTKLNKYEIEFIKNAVNYDTVDTSELVNLQSGEGLD